MSVVLQLHKIGSMYYRDVIHNQPSTCNDIYIYKITPLLHVCVCN